MDARVAARFFRVSEKGSDVPDFDDLLLNEIIAKDHKDRERNIDGDVRIRLERCESEGDFVAGEFCRKQTKNIPPQAGDTGLTPIVLPDGQGIGHVAAFRYHRPTRVLLLQTNRLSVTASRIAVYLAAVNRKGLYVLKPVFREDAWERFADKDIRRLSIGFASPTNLQALDDADLPIAKGARLLAEAYDGLEVDITVSVGRKRKTFLSKKAISQTLTKLFASGADLKNVDVKTSKADGGDEIDFIQEHLSAEKVLMLPDDEPDSNYKVRKAYLGSVFSANMTYLNSHYGTPDDGNDS